MSLTLDSFNDENTSFWVWLVSNVWLNYPINQFVVIHSAFEWAAIATQFNQNSSNKFIVGNKSIKIYQNKPIKYRFKPPNIPFNEFVSLIIASKTMVFHFVFYLKTEY